ncbi:MAG: SGNH/GDSL hydrolase family protein [Spirochaetaceae bacterium]|nr:SGNH/GDSL hydrolase family protein [Spirochaetaceae bacterium]
MILKKDSIFVVAGDSVTDCDRDFLAPTWKSESLGNGYAYFLQAALTGFCPELNVQVVNRGVGGDTSAQLLERWQEDVLELQPDFISILIGVNDAWRHFDGHARTSELIDVAGYKENCRSMIAAGLACGAGICIMSPFMLELNREDPLGAMVRQYAAAAREVAAEFHLPFVDLQAAFDQALFRRYTCNFSPDRIHPNEAAHMIILRELWRTLTGESLL